MCLAIAACPVVVDAFIFLIAGTVLRRYRSERAVGGERKQRQSKCCYRETLAGASRVLDEVIDRPRLCRTPVQPNE
jgi:hypothetical protein